MQEHLSVFICFKSDSVISLKPKNACIALACSEQIILVLVNVIQRIAILVNNTGCQMEKTFQDRF